MEFAAFKECVIARCKALGIEEYELYYTSGESTSVGVFQDSVSEFTASADGGVCFRCIVGGKMGYASTEALSQAQACAIVEKAADNASVLESEEAVFLSQGGQTYAELDLKPVALPDTETLVATALETQKKLYAADPAVIDGCQTEALAQRMELAIVNSKGLDLRYANTLTGIVAVAVVSDGKEMSNDFQIKIAPLDAIDTEELTKKAAAEAVLKMGGDVAPTGNYPVVFSPDAMASLLGAYSSVFSSETAQKGLSRLAGQEGTRVAAPFVTLVDDPFHGENPMPIHFDAEGSPTTRKNVIEKGVLKTLLYNLKTAAVAGKATTGNASKAGYDSPVGIRPFTMYLANGDLTEEELLQKAGSGIYITDLSGLHAGANPISGDFSLQSAGFMIENGRKAGYVKSFTVAGNFYELLKNITALADNCRLPRAMGMTAFGAPSVLVEGLSVAGK